jgi:hypothetical protein
MLRNTTDNAARRIAKRRWILCRQTSARLNVHRSTIGLPHTSSDPTNVPLQIGLNAIQPSFFDLMNLGMET